MIEKSVGAEVLVSFVAALKAIGLDVVKADSKWIENRFRSEGMLEASNIVAIEADQFPAVVDAYRVEGTPIILGYLDASKLHSAMLEARKYRNQVSIARSWLPVEAVNIQLFLLGPLGSTNDPQWQLIAAEIEADDRVCRKIVWLPPAEINDASVREFLNRTFLGKPWLKGSQRVRLDALAQVEVPPQWMVHINNRDLDAESLIRELVQIHMTKTETGEDDDEQ